MQNVVQTIHAAITNDIFAIKGEHDAGLRASADYATSQVLLY